MPSILITGAASGIGAGLAAELAAPAITSSSATSAAPTARRWRRSIRDGGGSADAVALDVTSDASVAAALAALSRPVDVLVNNAGLQHVAPLEEFPMTSGTSSSR